MARQNKYLENIYSVTSAEDMQRYYDRWADSYDDELIASGYQTPQRCAQALAHHSTDKAAPVLDFACGTGLSGLALREAGFTCIDGTDVSPGMLAQARQTGAYRQLLQGAIDQKLDLRDKGYAGIVASGAIGIGAAPAEYLDWAIDTLGPGGLFVVSLNDHTREDPDFEPRLTRAVDAGRAEMLHAEDGEHLPSMGLRARVYVLRKR
ncbi:MAG: class I SAM-dependent methyltransferase [Pararhodobacter sp.]|nr:class I SAM-dependent methyltransferase [Pararhodobacter sp.]